MVSPEVLGSRGRAHGEPRRLMRRRGRDGYFAQNQTCGSVGAGVG